MFSNSMCHSQLTRSLERILEEALISGELKLSNRKLRDFPKSVTSYNLSDTIKADLSRNRFCEIPDEITSFVFLETLILYHNAIRFLHSSIKELTSLTYLDLRSNQLGLLPRELCFLPVQVLLIANNRLTSLPEELGRMIMLKDLDASCNQISSLPTRFGDLKNLSHLSLRNNQLMFLPKEITSLPLIVLDLSRNKITSLPVEVRNMENLVQLNVENNPLTLPPASLCIRGLVHILKYLENRTTKDDKRSTAYNSSECHTMPRRKIQQDNLSKQIAKQEIYRSLELKQPEHYWNHHFSQNKTNINRREESDETENKNRILFGKNNSEYKFSVTKNEHKIHNYSSDQKEFDSSQNDTAIEANTPVNKNKEKPKVLENVQTYREYKEAIKQQRTEEINALYKVKKYSTSKTPEDCAESFSALYEKNIELNDTVNSPQIAKHHREEVYENGSERKHLDKPIQKVTPCRAKVAGLYQGSTEGSFNVSDLNYVKPSSPTKTVVTLFEAKPLKKISKVKTPMQRASRGLTESETFPEKLSFTMRREFDKQKEEIELTSQLRSIIESRLKMSLPEDLASALNDGVILCHLANYIQPRSVGSIHVPSPGVNLICCASDVLEGKGAVQVAVTVAELFRISEDPPNSQLLLASSSNAFKSELDYVSPHTDLL